MRKFFCFCKASCYVLSVLYLVCFAAHIAYGQQPAELSDSIHMELLSGLYISFPHKVVAFGSVDGLKKNQNKIFSVPAMLSADSAVAEAISILAISNNDSEAVIDSGTYVAVIPAASSDSLTKTDVLAIYKAIGRSKEPSLEDLMDPLISKYAEMISLDPGDIVNFPLYNFIEKWYGTRYRFGGTDNNGIDCSAFSQKLYGDVYKVTIQRNSRQQHRHSEHLGGDEAEEGDLVFFRMHHLRISHVGVYLANGYFVHASRSHGVVISSLNDRYWQHRFAGCGRIEKQERVVTESGSVD